MTDLERVMWEAWERVWPKLKGDPDEMRARLARRRGRMAQRPLRAFCLAVRASDRRINGMRACIVPMWGEGLGVRDRGRRAEHVAEEVELDRRLLVEICRPVRVDAWGELVEEVAGKLGCHSTGLKGLGGNGRLEEKFVKGLAGRKGKRVAMVRCGEMLDPSAWGKSRPDPIWGGLWMYHAEWLEEGFAQVVRRWAVWQGERPNGRRGEGVKGDAYGRVDVWGYGRDEEGTEDCGTATAKARWREGGHAEEDGGALEETES